MDDLINREALLDCMQKDDQLMSLDVRRYIIDAPAVDAEPVRHGKWLKVSEMLPPEWRDKKRCSVCANFALHDRLGRVRPSNYCPNCGAKMDNEREDE